jgi:subtilisin family serine protease
MRSGIPRQYRTEGLKAGMDSMDKLNERFGVVEIQSIFKTNNPPLSGYYKVKFGSQIDISSVINEYRADPNVEHAEPNYAGFTTVTPHDSHYGFQWAHAQMQSELGWNIQTGLSTVTIAIIDTGVDWNHADLSANVWISSNETLNGIDDDDNGYIDDIRGWDFVDTNDPVWPGEDGKIRDNDPMDFHGHGTHVAGIAARANCDITGEIPGLPDNKINIRDAGQVAEHWRNPPSDLLNMLNEMDSDGIVDTTCVIDKEIETITGR